MKKIFRDSALDSATVVGCGQSSHGSHENFLLQSLVFKYLVEVRGCRTFVIEASYPDLLNVNQYVSSGIGKPEEVMKSLGFWIWETKEVWQLIEWIRTFNSSRANDDKILFLGNDMQSVTGAAKGVQEFFRNFLSEKAKNADQLLQPMLDSTLVIDPANRLTKQLFTSNIAAIRDLATDLKEPADSNRTEEFTLRERCIDLLEQSVFFSYDQFSRDSLMALNVKWVVDQSFRKGPVFIWAHNGHIESQCENNNVRMGCYLKNYYGSDYYTLGIDFITGEFNAKKFGPRSSSDSNSQYTVLPQSPCSFSDNAPGSLIERFSKMDHQLIFFRAKDSKHDSLFKTFDLYEFGSLHEIGAVFDSLSTQKDPTLTYEYTLPYDGVLIFRHSTPTWLIKAH
ncbi:MAG TPA: erythromycin esterase family protein [Bacteroidia bacterium]|nr:erythromycin esterase family protein [Bacteroidia bacterium]